MGELTKAKAGPDTGALEARQPNGCMWPVPPPDGYSMDDLYELDLPPRTQLIDGSLVFASPQREFHTVATCLLESGLRSAAPESLRVRRGMAVVLGPRNVPVPDLVAVMAEADGDPRITHYEASDVALAVEVVSPDSEDRDRDTKPHKYARAGIPHFWRVEMAAEDGRPVVHVHKLRRGVKEYALTGVHHDLLKLTVPYDISIDLTEIDLL